MGFSVLNYAAGAIKWIFTVGKSDFPSVSFRGGGIIVKGPLLMEGDRGITLGPFVNVGPDASEATIQHELAHVRQYKEWGGWKYMSHLWSSPLGGGAWAEHNANERAGTFASYANDDKMALIVLMGIQMRDPVMRAIFFRSMFSDLINVPTR